MPLAQYDLTALRYGYRNSLLLIESKDDAKKRGIKSPDRADSFMLTFAYPVVEANSYTEAQAPDWRM